MNYANIGGEPVDLDDPEQAPPWYDPDAVHDRNATAERPPPPPVSPFAWPALVGKRATIATDHATYGGVRVIEYHSSPYGVDKSGWIEIEYVGRLGPTATEMARTPPTVRALVNLAHVRTIRPL